MSNVHWDRFVIHLSHQDRIDVEIMVKDGRMAAFSLNYRAEIHGLWREILRYDTAHDRPHRHRTWSGATEPPDDVTHWLGPDGSLETAYDRAQDDISENWKRYRAYAERHYALEGP